MFKQYTTHFYHYSLNKPRARKKKKTREAIVSHKPKASDLQAFRVLFQHLKWFVEPINHRNVWYIACI